MNNRYSRQELFSPIGEEGQQKIREKHVLIIGAGALGSANAEMFVRAGVGTVTIVDRDYVDWSNLQRQQLYAESDVENNLPKAVAAKKRLEEINSEVRVEALVQDVTAEELEELVTNVDVMIDATDNFETRFIVNDMAQKYSIPWIYGACVGVTVFLTQSFLVKRHVYLVYYNRFRLAERHVIQRGLYHLLYLSSFLIK